MLSSATPEDGEVHADKSGLHILESQSWVPNYMHGAKKIGFSFTCSYNSICMVELHAIYRDFLFNQHEPWRYSVFPQTPQVH